MEEGKFLPRDFNGRIGSENAFFIRQGREGVEVGLTLHDRKRDFVLVPIDAEDDPVEARLAGEEKALVAFEDDGFPFFQRGKAERAGTHGPQVGGMGVDGRAVSVDMGGQDRDQCGDETLEQGGLWDGRFQIKRQVVHRDGLVHGFEHGAERMVPLRRADGKGHVIGCDRGTVMEGSAFAEMKPEPSGLGIDVPRFRKVGDGAVLSNTDQPGEQLRPDLAGQAAAGYGGVEAVREPFQRYNKAVVFRGGGGRGRGGQGEKEQGRGQEGRQTCMACAGEASPDPNPGRREVRMYGPCGRGAPFREGRRGRRKA